MGTETNPGAFDCHAKAAPDEPTFTLLGRDRHAGLLIRLWALVRHREGEDEEVVAEALRCADAADDWARKLGRDPAAVATDYEELLMSATAGTDEHPEDYECACDCDLCRLYG